MTEELLIRKVGGFVTGGMVEEGYRKCIDAARGNTQLIAALELERKGGHCPSCDTLFVEVRVENRFGKFSYFEPGCYCYKKCITAPAFRLNKNGERKSDGNIAGCGRFLVAEKFLGIDHCTNCNPGGVEVKKREKKETKDYQRDGKTAAAGEEKE